MKSKNIKLIRENANNTLRGQKVWAANEVG